MAKKSPKPPKPARTVSMKDAAPVVPKPEARATRAESSGEDGGVPMTSDGAVHIISSINVPTKLGPCCHDEDGRYTVANVGIKREGDGRCLLWTTNGHSLVIVPSEIDDTNEGELPRRIPAALATPAKGGARELTFGVGTSRTIFGYERVWVDNDAGRFEPETIEGSDPPLADVLPDLDGAMFVGLNAEMLHKLAAAVNSPDGPNAVSKVVLAIRDSDKPIAIIGDCGVGVLMPVLASENLDAPRFKALAKRFAVASGRDPGPAPKPEPTPEPKPEAVPGNPPPRRAAKATQPDGENQHLAAAVAELEQYGSAPKTTQQLVSAGYETVGAVAKAIEDGVDLEQALDLGKNYVASLVEAVRKYRTAHRRADLAVEREAAGAA